MSFDITALLRKAFNSDEVKVLLQRLNAFHYNRKHEGPIRDWLVEQLSATPDVVALGEFPRGTVLPRSDSGKPSRMSMDVSLWQVDARGLPMIHSEPLACIELKHQYPVDFKRKDVRTAIERDLQRRGEWARPVGVGAALAKTADDSTERRKFGATHMIVIVQDRMLKYPDMTPFGALKYLDPAQEDIEVPEAGEHRAPMGSPEWATGTQWRRIAQVPVHDKRRAVFSRYTIWLSEIAD